MKKAVVCLLVLSFIALIGAMAESGTLQKGDSGEAVLAVQEVLVSMNYLSQAYATGEYEDMTEIAVLAFQLDHGLTPTGVADSETQRAIADTVQNMDTGTAGDADDASPSDEEIALTEAATPEPTVNSHEESDREENTAAKKKNSHYILNRKTHKFHIPTCSGVEAMKEKNKIDFYGTREEAIAQGYSPCGLCEP